MQKLSSALKARKLPITAAFILSATVSQGALAASNPYAYSPQDTLIGLTPALQASANNGAGVIVGDIDTGVQSQWLGFNSTYNTSLAKGASNIDSKDSAECLNGACPVVKNGSDVFPTDGNGHGTFTASEIVGGVQSAGLVGVAPAASLMSVQVLNAQGSGTSTDVANGIIYAANHGAEVLNLSLGPSGTAAQQAAFYESLASAINYAASKGTIIVFAGGNSSQALAGGTNITGFTDQAIAHMIFMGSTNSSEKLSSFSNTPGKAGFVSTTGKFTAYDTMWMMADGENIWGASTSNTGQCKGYVCIQQDSGTSMAAPQATGAAALLLAHPGWGFLLSAGTIPQILEQSAKDLGTKGIDTTYGDGFLNVAAAFNAIGTLSVPTSGGKNVPINGGGQILSSGALGNMGKVASAMSQAVAYDSFMRPFPIYTSSSIVNQGVSSPISPATAQVSGLSGGNARSFVDQGNGNWLALTGSAPTANAMPGDNQQSGFMADPTRPYAGEWSYGFSAGGSYVGVGQGSGAALSFNDARWGGSNAFFNTDSTASGSVLGLVQNANFASAGMAMSGADRLAVSLVSTSGNTLSSPGDAGAHGGAMAYTMQPTDNLKVSLTSTFLTESNQLLGSPSVGYLGLGPQASTASVGIGTNLDLGHGYQLGFDAAYASTSATHNSDSLIGSTSRLGAESFSAALAKDNVTGAGDRLGFTLDKPLRVVSGSANLAVPVGTDNNSQPIIQTQKVGLAPSGSETDVGFAYNRPIDSSLMSSLNLVYRADADNIAGAHDAAAMVRFKLGF